MKRIIYTAFLCLLIASNAICAERPTVNIPPPARQQNWQGRQGQGSCVHATMISLFRWQGRYNTAEYWRRTYSDGEWPGGLNGKFEQENIRYAYTVNGDVKFLEWACKTRRGCGITVMGGAHMVALVHLDSKWAAILDNNNISKFTWIPRETLIAEWKASYGWAVTPVYTPAAPLPIRTQAACVTLTQRGCYEEFACGRRLHCQPVRCCRALRWRCR